MKKSILMVLTVFVVVPLLGCQNNKGKKTSVNTNRGGRGSISTGGVTGTHLPPQNSTIPSFGQNMGRYTPCPSKVFGTISGGNRYSDDQFQDMVQDFVWDPDGYPEVGYVSSYNNQSTGIRFCGQVETLGVRFNPMGLSSASLNTANFLLHITIWDSLAGSLDSSGGVTPEYAVDVYPGPGHSIQGQVQGNSAYIRFNQAWVHQLSKSPRQGSIEMSGQFDARYFYGQVWFDNRSGAANYLGEFVIETCGFFKCN